jgi:hypothetical protein
MKKTTFTPKPSPKTSPTNSLDAFVGGSPAEPTGEKMKRLTIDVPQNLHRRVKAGCAVRGIEMASLMREFLEKEFPSV